MWWYRMRLLLHASAQASLWHNLCSTAPLNCNTTAPSPPVLQGRTTHMMTNTAAADPSEPSLILIVHGGVRRLPDGRPLLHVSCVDQDAAKRAFPTEAARQVPFARRARGRPGIILDAMAACAYKTSRVFAACPGTPQRDSTCYMKDLSPSAIPRPHPGSCV